jgi:hypothetical protein
MQRRPSGPWRRHPPGRDPGSCTLASVRKLFVLIALLLAAALPVQSAAQGSGTGTIKGVVYDATCYGPCRYPPPPPRLYTHDNLVVTIRSLPDRELVAKLYPTDGRFQIEVAPGPYRVRAFIRNGGSCWEGEAKKVQVVEDQTTRVRLHVYNACIV